MAASSMMYSRVEKSFMAIYKCKEMKAYLNCLEKHKELDIASIREKIDLMQETFNRMKNTNADKDPVKTTEMFIDVLVILKNLIKLRSDPKLIKYGSAKCTKEFLGVESFQSAQTMKMIDDVIQTMTLLKAQAEKNES